MTNEELQELDRLLVKFGALVLNRPYLGKNDDTKNNAVFQRVTYVRKHVNAEVRKA